MQSASNVKTTLTEFIKHRGLSEEDARKIKDGGLCVPDASKIIHYDESSPNIFLGVGIWSAKHGLSQGLPIDVLSPLLIAARICKITHGKIHLLIGDSFAVDSSQGRENITPKDIKNCADDYEYILANLVKSLKITELVEIHRLSALDGNVTYQEHIHLANVKMQQLCRTNCIATQSLDETNINYLVKQTAIGHFFKTHYQCGIKIGWCRYPKNIGYGIY